MPPPAGRPPEAGAVRTLLPARTGVMMTIVTTMAVRSRSRSACRRWSRSIAFHITIAIGTACVYYSLLLLL